MAHQSAATCCKIPSQKLRFTSWRNTIFDTLRGMNGIKFGYARVSTHEQTRDLQIDALRQYGCEGRRIFTDTYSGSVACVERPQLQRLCEQLREGDVLTVWNLDRLGCDLQDLLTFVDSLGKQGIGFVSLT